VDDAQLLAYSDGSYSTSDWGCVGDTIGIAPRIYPVPDYVKEYTDWRAALVEADDTCALQNGVCWILKAEDQLPRYGQESDGGCPGCRGPGPIGFDGLFGELGDLGNGDLGKYPRNRRRSMGPRKPYQGAVRMLAERTWRPVAVMTTQGLGKVMPDGSVLPFWQQIFHVTAPNRVVHQPSSMTYKAAVAAAQVLSQRLGKPLVVNATHRGREIPMTYVDPGGIVRTDPRVKGWETGVYSMDPLEVRQAFLASRGGSLMPHGM
jgi:hypothetical protein